jgi:hypothetical protein
MTRLGPALALSLLVAVNGCAMRPPVRCAEGLQAREQHTLYFGRATPDGRVSDAQWEGFVREVVTPRFPDGLTVWPAAGQWRSSAGEIVREDSHVLTVLHEARAADRAAIDAILAEYRRRFRQEAVLQVKQSVCAGF